MLTLRELKHVLAMSESGSVGEAAHKLELTQPALSQSIAAIEKKLETQLFVRGRRSLTATKAGELVVRRARQILNQVDRINADLDALRDEHSGRVRFGIGPAAAALYLEDSVKLYCRERELEPPHFSIGFWDSMEQVLADGEIDFFLGGFLHPLKDSRFSADPFSEDSLVALARPGHPLVGPEQRHVRDLIHYPVLSYPTRKYILWRNLTEASDHELLRRNIPAATMENPLDAAEMLMHTNYVMIVTETNWRVRAHRLRLREINVSDLRGRAMMQLVRNAGHSPSQYETRMVECLTLARDMIDRRCRTDRAADL